MFKENEHPRDVLGRFTDKNDLTESKTKELSAKYEDVFPQEKISTKAKNKTDFFGVEHKGVCKEILSKENERKGIQKDISLLLGKEYKGYKGQKAIEKLLQEKQGHIKGAFYREDIGNIDLIWGNDSLGLQHIIKHRVEQGINSSEFLSNLAEVVEKGEYKGKNKNNTFEFWYKGKMAIISPEYHNQKNYFSINSF